MVNMFWVFQNLVIFIALCNKYIVLNEVKLIVNKLLSLIIIYSTCVCVLNIIKVYEKINIFKH